MENFDRLFEDSGALVACYRVQPDLEQLLTPEEADSMLNAVQAVRNRAAAARIAARALLEQVGFPGWSMPHRRGASPDWPPGWVGSLSHSDHYGAAALEQRAAVSGIGIDIEPSEPLPEELQSMVVVRGDVAPKDSGKVAGRILFCAKEATFKAVYPVDGCFLDFEDVIVNFDSGLAETSNGRQVSLSLHIDHRIVVLARLRG